MVLGLAGTLAVGLAGSVAVARAPRASLADFVCQRALDPPARTISVKSVMRPVPGTQKLALRFQLLMRRHSFSSPTLVRGGDLGTWISPQNPTLGQLPGDVWKVSHPVVDLTAPAAYRFRVTFRWIGAHRRLLATAQRVSPLCFQPELRPDLLVKSITVLPIAGKPNRDDYLAVIRNAGATAAGPFDILFTPGGTLAPKSRTIQRLDPHQGHRELFVGPLCMPGDAPTVTVDPGQLVDDFDRSNNTLIATCPATVS